MTADNDAATTANLRQEWEQCVRQLLEGPSGKDAVVRIIELLILNCHSSDPPIRHLARSSRYYSDSSCSNAC